MDNATIRPWRPEDRPRLVELWQACFDDDLDYINAYHALFLRPDNCLVAEADGTVVSAMYIMSGPLLFPPSGRSLSTAYLYALGTDPAYRGRGLGSAVFKACAASALQWADAVCVHPAGPELYPFYQKAAGSVPVCHLREAVLTREELPPAVRKAAVISSGEYYLRRKALLRGQPYAVMPSDFLALEAHHMRRFGGGIVSVDGDIAAVELAGDTCRVLELLAPEGDWAEVLAAVAERFPAKRYAVRTPLFFPGPGEARPFILAALGPDIQERLPDELWWGFAFD